jgi:hypothetical protein
MNRPLTALFAAFEATLVVAIGIGISLAPLTILWGVQYGFASDWAVFWRAAVDIWLVGHGVDIRLQLDPALAAGLGLPGADAAFPLTIAALGFALLTVLLGIRAGSRVAETRFRLLGEIVAVATFGLLSLAATLSALYPYARPSIVQGALFPTLVFGVGVLLGSLRTRKWRRSRTGATPNAAEHDGSSLSDWFNDWNPTLRAITATATRAGAGAAAAILAVSSLTLAFMLAINYAGVVALYEGLQTGVLGGIVLTIGQLAFIPNLVIWAMAWLVGPGFSIGTGSIVSPLATQLGPIPAIPAFGAIPTGDLSWAFLSVLLPIVTGFLVAAVTRPTLVRELGDYATGRWLSLAGVAVGLVSGAILGFLAGLAGGSAGPGRLAHLGPDALSVGLCVALEVAVGAVAGFLATRPPREVSESSR